MRIEVVGAPLDLADELQEQFAVEAKAAMGRAGDALLREVQRKLGEQKGPDPSAPGQPPAFQSGELFRSIRRIPPRVKGRVAWSGVRTNHPGAGRLEYKLGRPFLGPALEAVRPEVERLMQEILAR